MRSARSIFVAGTLVFSAILSADAQTIVLSADLQTIRQWDLGVRENAGAITITVLRDGNTNDTTVVNYRTDDTRSNAKAGIDYVDSAGQLSFAPGQTVAGFEIPILDNSDVDFPAWLRTRILEVALSVEQGGQISDRAQVFIQDNEFDAADFDSSSAPFARPVFSALAQSGQALITLRRVGESSQLLTLRYSTTDGTGIAGRDYTAVFRHAHLSSARDREGLRRATCLALGVAAGP